MPIIFDAGGNAYKCNTYEFTGSNLILRNSAGTITNSFVTSSLDNFYISDSVEAMKANALDEDNTYAVGQTIAATETYTDTPLSVTLVSQWQTSDDGETDWADIAEATDDTYVIASTDYGKFLRRKAFATGQAYGEKDTGASDAVIGVLASAAITGTAQVGEELTAVPTTNPESGVSPTPTYSYRWLICDTVDGTYEAIELATSSTYTALIGDLDKFIKAEIIATVTAIGVATSEATTVVIAA